LITGKYFALHLLLVTLLTSAEMTVPLVFVQPWVPNALIIPYVPKVRAHISNKRKNTKPERLILMILFHLKVKLLGIHSENSSFRRFLPGLQIPPERK